MWHCRFHARGTTALLGRGGVGGTRVGLGSLMLGMPPSLAARHEAVVCVRVCGLEEVMSSWR